VRTATQWCDGQLRLACASPFRLYKMRHMCQLVQYPPL
jgi:hypothetical protein